MKLRNIILCILVFSSFICCHKTTDSDYFNGKIIYIDDSSKKIKKVKLKALPLFGANHGRIAVYDSDQPVHEMWLDQVRNRLYTINSSTDEVFYLDLDELSIL